MTETKILLIDMDAIVADLAGEWYARWNKHQYDKWYHGNRLLPQPKEIKVEDMKAWDVAKTTGDGRIYDVLREPGLYRELKPFPKSQEVIYNLSKKKLDNGKPAFDILFLTASITAPNILADKAYWMKDHFPFMGPKQLILAYRKELVRGDFFIDDSPKNLRKFREAQPKANLITIDYPYNQLANVDLRARAWNNMDAAWEQIERYLDLHAQLPEGYQFGGQ